MENENRLERISWREIKWINSKGEEVNPVKIGDSFAGKLTIGHPFVVPSGSFTHKEHGERLQKILNNSLKKQESSGYISKDQRNEINSYSINPDERSANDLYAISFYKI